MIGGEGNLTFRPTKSSEAQPHHAHGAVYHQRDVSHVNKDGLFTQQEGQLQEGHVRLLGPSFVQL